MSQWEYCVALTFLLTVIHVSSHIFNIYIYISILISVLIANFNFEMLFLYSSVAIHEQFYFSTDIYSTLNIKQSGY